MDADVLCLEPAVRVADLSDPPAMAPPPRQRQHVRLHRPGDGHDPAKAAKVQGAQGLGKAAPAAAGGVV